MGASFLLLAASLMFTPRDEWRLVTVLERSMAMFLIGSSAVALGFPLARLAETFEYDVLRRLNKPNALRGAMAYVGPQFLPHMHHLEWGFRYLGNVINFKTV